MQEMGKFLALAGVAMTLIGLFLWKFSGRIPIGRLPGDISIQRENFSFYFPLTTCIAISLGLSFILWLVRKLS
jgi:hypothetical protein